MRILTFDPRIPFALWWPLALAVVALLIVYALSARHRLSRGRYVAVVALMTAAAAVPLLLLLNPTWLDRIPPPAGKPLLTILVDRSGSMATPDSREGAPRFQVAARAAARTAAELADRYEVRIRTFAGDWTSVAPGDLNALPADGTSTHLAAAVEQAIDEAHVQGQAILLLADGIENAPGGGTHLRQAAARARALAVPIYTHTLGEATEVDDLEVTLNLPQELAFASQKVPVAVSVRQRGRLAQKATLTLSLDDQSIESRQITLAPDDAVEELFYVVQADSGVYHYTVSVEPVAGEVTEVNNSASLLMRVVDEPVRVLLLEGKPYWDTKFLIRTLVDDPSVELTSVIRMTDDRLLQRVTSRPRGDKVSTAAKETGGTGEGAEAAPDSTSPDEEPGTPADRWSIREDAGSILADADTLADYQVVLLGRDAEVFLTDEALQNVRRWLADGNVSLVCYRGAPASQIGQRLGELLPVRWSPSGETRYRVQMTDAGRALRWLPPEQQAGAFNRLPSLATASHIDSVQPMATVLATTDGDQPTPILAYQPYGSGRVVVVEGAGMWRWAFLTDAEQDEGKLYGTFWRSLVRWLVSNVGLLPSQRMALRTDKVTFNTDESVSAMLLVHRDHLASDVPQIELHSGNAEPALFTPVPMGDLVGRFQVRFGRLAEGRYRARIAGTPEEDISSAAIFDVRGSLVEQLDIRSRPDVMNLLAEESGGAVLKVPDAEVLAERFEAHRRRSQPERFVETPAWDRWWLLSGSFVLWTVAWGLRRRSGLI